MDEPALREATPLFPRLAGVEEAAEAVTGQSFAAFFRDYVAGVKEIPYDDFFQFAGLHVVVNATQLAAAGFTTSANLGAQPEVVQIDPNSDAQRLGVRVGDRVTALNGKPTDAQLDDEYRECRLGRLSICNWKTGAQSAKWN